MKYIWLNLIPNIDIFFDWYIFLINVTKIFEYPYFYQKPQMDFHYLPHP